jgi:hypothetical protein
MIIEFEIYTANSVSGGKVWGVPVNHNKFQAFHFTIFGKLETFNRGKVTVRESKSYFDAYDKIVEKRNKGYVRTHVEYVNVNTGEVLWNYQPPKTVNDLVQEKASLIALESSSNLPRKGHVISDAPFAW